MKKTVSLVLVLARIAVVWTGFGSAASASEAQAMNNTEKALALISTFATGDTDTARDLLADDYIQHNLAYGTGADAFIGSVDVSGAAVLAPQPVSTVPIMARAIVRERIFFILSDLLGDWACFRLPLAL